MKKLLRYLTKKRIILGSTCILSLLIFALLSGVSSYLARAQEDQGMAKRWSGESDVAQISCFFAQSVKMSENSILSFEHGLDSALVEASIVSQSENASARLWADAYSATGMVSLTSNQATVSVNAIGIGGDFFLFHPVKLKSGAYFSGSDVMKDYCILDEETAWQLFGSNDIAGQMITIGGIPHMITGVYQREKGSLAGAAGLDEALVFVSYETLSKYGMANEIGCYEIVMPNPVKEYAYNYVSEKIGAAETEMEVVENTSRYTVTALLQCLTEFGTRSMSSKAIIYPYWENIARGYEDILVLILVFRILFVLYPAGVVLIAAVLAWKNKTWTAKGVFLYLKDKWERRLEEMRAKKRRRKNEKVEKV